MTSATVEDPLKIRQVPVEDLGEGVVCAVLRTSERRTEWQSVRTSSRPASKSTLSQEAHFETRQQRTVSPMHEQFHMQKPKIKSLSLLINTTIQKESVKRYNRPCRCRGEGEVYLYSYFNLGARSGAEVHATPRPLYPRETVPVSIVREAGWAPGPLRKGAKNIAPTGNRFPDRPSRSESLYRLGYSGPRNSL